jgi:hypothetical protein
MSNVNLEQQTRESVTTLELFQYRGKKKKNMTLQQDRFLNFTSHLHALY